MTTVPQPKVIGRGWFARDLVNDPTWRLALEPATIEALVAAGHAFRFDHQNASSAAREALTVLLAPVTPLVHAIRERLAGFPGFFVCRGSQSAFSARKKPQQLISPLVCVSGSL